MKCKDKCILCDKFLRTKKNDFEDRLTCYECYGKNKYTNKKLIKLYPDKVIPILYKKYIVNFGKYKDKTYEDVSNDVNYSKWLLSNINNKRNTLIKYLSYIYI